MFKAVGLNNKAAPGNTHSFNLEYTEKLQRICVSSLKVLNALDDLLKSNESSQTNSSGGGGAPSAKERLAKKIRERASQVFNDLRKYRVFNLEDELDAKIEKDRLQAIRDVLCIIRDLSGAVIATVKYIESRNNSENRETKPLPSEFKRKEPPEFVITGAKANIECLKLFITCGKKGLTQSEQSRLFGLLFGRHQQPTGCFVPSLEAVGSLPFCSGVWTAIKAYWYLKEKHEGFVFMPPKDVGTDVHWSVDLVGRLGEEKRPLELRFYQIKGRSKGKEGVDIFDLSSQEDIKRLEQNLENLPDKERKEHEKGIKDIQDYVVLKEKEEHDKGNTGCEVTAYWVEAFADFEKDREELLSS
jgi:hypothetical protein